MNGVGLSGCRVGWQWPAALMVIATLAFLSLLLWNSGGDLLYMLFVVPLVILTCIVLVIISAIRKKRYLIFSQLFALIGFIAISGVLLKAEGALRPWLRWLLVSRRYKAQLLAQPNAANGGLKHIVWDTWGFVPSGFNVVYLVFDPTDSLAGAVSSDRPSKPAGIPCEVPTVRRLENQWYAVEFYTDEDWNHCPSAGPLLDR